MASNLQDTIRRCRQRRTFDGGATVTTDSDWHNPTSAGADDHALASAYLLDHPEDDRDEVIGLWLMELGFERFTVAGDPPAYGIKCYGGGTLVWHPATDPRVKHAWTYRDPEGDCVALPPWSEKGQARTLFRAVAAMIGGATATPLPELGSM